MRGYMLALVAVVLLVASGNILAQEDWDPMFVDPQEGFYFRSSDYWWWAHPNGQERIRLVSPRNDYGETLVRLEQIGPDMYQWMTAFPFSVSLHRNGELLVRVDADRPGIGANEDYIVMAQEGRMTWTDRLDPDFASPRVYGDFPHMGGWLRMPDQGASVATLYYGELTVVDLEAGEVVLTADSVDQFAFGSDSGQFALVRAGVLQVYEDSELALSVPDPTAEDLVFCGDVLYYETQRTGSFDIAWVSQGEARQLTFNPAVDINPVCGPDEEVPMFLSDRNTRGGNANFLPPHYDMFVLTDLNANAVLVSADISIIGSPEGLLYFQESGR